MEPYSLVADSGLCTGRHNKLVVDAGHNTAITITVSVPPGNPLIKNSGHEGEEKTDCPKTCISKM